MSVTANDILAALVEQAGKYIWCKELAFSGGARRCDFWTMEPHPSKSYRATAYEIKVSRGDFKRDSHKKQREARLFSDRFFYVTPAGLLKPDEVPDWAGLLEFDGQKFARVIEAPVRDKDAPSWELVVSLIRYNSEIRRDVGKEQELIRSLRYQIDQAKAKIIEDGRRPWEFGLHD